MQMRVSNNLVDRVRAGQRLGAVLRFELVVVSGGRCAPYRFCRFTFAELRCDPTQEIGWDRYVVAIRRSWHLGAAFKPPKTGETNEVAPNGNVSAVADAGYILHVHEIDTPTLDPELTQSCPRVDAELPESCRHPGIRCATTLSATSRSGRENLYRRRSHRAPELR